MKLTRRIAGGKGYSMGISSKTTGFKFAIFGLVLIATACSPTFRYHGYAPSEDQLENVLVGVDTKGTVEEVIGRPSNTGMLQDGGWYYISLTKRYFAYREPKVIERQMVAISFGPDETVTNIERFGLEDGRVVTLSRRTTATAVKSPTFLGQMLRNIGNLDAGKLLGN